jgi:adenine-specific DNA-methyltransferase
MPESIARARQLRRNATDAERKLWSLLRDRRLGGIKFRRQHPRGPYTLDFYWAEAALVIEVDGGQHAERVEEDAQRTAYLEREGLRVLRLWNRDVLLNPEGCFLLILEALRERSTKSPSPCPSPR